jgi:hypothetical protein
MAENDPAPDPDPVPTPDPPKATEEPVKPDDDWQAKARKHERDLKRERKAREDLEAKLAEADNASKSEHEKALEQARKDARAEAKAETTSEFREQILTAEIRVQAAGKFADPGDAVALLDLKESEVFNNDGEIQTADLTQALDDLLERKPHLAAGPANPGRPLGSVDAGKGASAAPTGTPEEQHNTWLAGVLKQA